MLSILFLGKSIDFGYDFLYQFYESSWVKSFNFGCDLTIVDFALLFWTWS